MRGLAVGLVAGDQFGALRFGELFEHDVQIQSADAEGVDAGAPRQTVGLLGPGRDFAVDIEWNLVPVDLGVE